MATCWNVPGRSGICLGQSCSTPCTNILQHHRVCYHTGKQVVWNKVCPIWTCSLHYTRPFASLCWYKMNILCLRVGQPFSPLSEYKDQTYCTGCCTSSIIPPATPFDDIHTYTECTKHEQHLSNILPSEQPQFVGAWTLQAVEAFHRYAGPG